MLPKLARSLALRPRLLLLAALLALGAAGCNSDTCTPGSGDFGTRCCEPGDCQSGFTCHNEKCTKPCAGAADCPTIDADGGTLGCSADGFCATPIGGGSGTGEHGW